MSLILGVRMSGACGENKKNGASIVLGFVYFNPRCSFSFKFSNIKYVDIFFGDLFIFVECDWWWPIRQILPYKYFNISMKRLSIFAEKFVCDKIQITLT